MAYATGTLTEISIHVPTRGTTHGAYAHAIEYEFQSTCPRGARPHPLISGMMISHISIHVPTRGTTYNAGIKWEEYISIHVPTRGTTLGTSNRKRGEHFNPRAHEGHDRQHRQ